MINSLFSSVFARLLVRTLRALGKEVGKNSTATQATNKTNKSFYLSVNGFNTLCLLRTLYINKELVNRTEVVKNPNSLEADKLAIYKAQRSRIRDHRTQIHLVAARRI